MYKGIQGGAHTLGPGVYPGWAILAEGILTFLLVFTVLLTAVDEENSSLAPLAIGFAVAVDIIAGYVLLIFQNCVRVSGVGLLVESLVDGISFFVPLGIISLICRRQS